MKIFIVLALIFLLLILWLSFDFSFGRKRQIKGLKPLNSPLRESHMDMFTKGPELFEEYFSELQKAKHHIHIQFYIVKDDKISQKFFSILKAKAVEGIEVRLLLDRMGSFPIKKKLRNELKSHGIEFSFSNKIKLPFLFYSLQARNHRKVTVIDGKVGYVGGFNIGKEYVNQDKKLNPWRDYHLKITGEGVADLQREFLSDWAYELGNDLLANMDYFPLLAKGKVQHKLVPSKGAYLEETFSALIHQAKSSIFIGTPYFIPSPQLVNDLSKAMNRGVTLTILVPKITDHLLVKEASYPYLRKLLKNGAHVYEFLNGFYHAKTMIIDDEICDIGTANFDRRSLFINYEMNCYIFDHSFIKEVLDVIQLDLQNSMPLTLEALNKPDPQRTVKEWIARWFVPLL
ncbi:cardiolipin synthase [Cytobacillus eiseniae]|uniref:Cardiolipin synthase n=1 Tax=Cytobacillus eiseniae TaxID=762947 RepID=A0ABS4RHZ0_9BACI|nr:cardiolipin synthase [Cytobacillus eiseniae]MBP2242532.1 cardiolipin synthase [Cytobacillus eiseniae]